MYAHAVPRGSRMAAWPALAVACWLIGGGSSMVMAAGPAIEFDMAPAIECRDVTTPEFAATHADLKVIEALVQVSVRLTQGNASDVRELIVEIDSPEQRLLVLDYTPGQTLESSVEGPIEVTKTHETSATLGGGLSGGAGLPFGPITAQLTPNAALGKSQRRPGHGAIEAEGAAKRRRRRRYNAQRLRRLLQASPLGANAARRAPRLCLPLHRTERLARRLAYDLLPRNRPAYAVFHQVHQAERPTSARRGFVLSRRFGRPRRRVAIGGRTKAGSSKCRALRCRAAGEPH